MNAPNPPALATWLLNRLVTGEKRDSMIGDLIEQHQRGRSSLWYWRQAVKVMAWDLAATLWTHKWVAIAVVALNALLPYLYLSFIFHWVTIVDRAWYPPLMNWLIETAWNRVWHAVYGLTTGLTGQVAWCLLIFSVAWIFVRLRSDACRIVVTLLVLSEVGQCVPGLRHTFASWWHDPDDFIGFLTAFRFAIFMFVAIPFSIVGGGRAASWEARREFAA